MYCKLKAPASILYRLNTGEVLLRIQAEDGVIVICDFYLELDTIARWSCETFPTIVNATIADHDEVATITCSAHSHPDFACYWFNSQNYVADRVITCDVFMHGNTIVQIPYALSDLFAITPDQHYDSVQHPRVHHAVSSMGTGYTHIQQFKCKMMHTLATLSRLIMIPQELRVYIVSIVCHLYKNCDYVEYLQLR